MTFSPPPKYFFYQLSSSESKMKINRQFFGGYEVAWGVMSFGINIDFVLGKREKKRSTKTPEIIAIFSKVLLLL